MDEPLSIFEGRETTDSQERIISKIAFPLN